MDLKVITPVTSFRELPESSVWKPTYRKLYELIQAHQTTLVFAGMRSQTEKIARELNQLHRLITDRDKPVIVAGDFNAFWGDRELELFLAASGMVSANMQCESSFPSNFPVRELDFIFHSPEIRSIGFQVPQVRLSDHLPLIWDFDVQSEMTIPPFSKPADVSTEIAAPIYL